MRLNPAEDIVEAQGDQLETLNRSMLESIINRLAMTSVILKAAVLAFAAILIAGCFINADNSHFHVASVMIVIVWVLDAYYLKMERGFRGIFFDYSVNMRKVCNFTPVPVKLRTTMFSKTMVWFYVPLLVLTGIEFLMH